MKNEIETKWDSLWANVIRLSKLVNETLNDFDAPLKWYNEAKAEFEEAKEELEEFEKKHFDICGVCGDRHPAPECNDYSSTYDY